MFLLLSLLSIIADMKDINDLMKDHIHFVIGSSSDITAYEDAHANEADRVLLLPYSKWYDYEV